MGRRAWELAASQNSEWSMVIQDDAIVCRDLIPGLEKILHPFNGRGLISPYTGTGRPDQQNVHRMLSEIQNSGENWGYLRSLNWGVAIIVPTDTVQGMLDWCSADKNADKNYDHRIGMYYRDVIGWRTWYTHPSLVDHPGQGSIIGHDSPLHSRSAYNFIGEDASPLDSNWVIPPNGFRAEHEIAKRRRGGVFGDVRRPRQSWY